MDDLVDDEPLAERLRNGDDLRSRIEAADRIEKLEAAMQDIAGPAANIDVAKAIARVALRATITSSAR